MVLFVFLPVRKKKGGGWSSEYSRCGEGLGSGLDVGGGGRESQGVGLGGGSFV